MKQNNVDRTVFSIAFLSSCDGQTKAVPKGGHLDLKYSVSHKKPARPRRDRGALERDADRLTEPVVMTTNTHRYER